MNKLVEFTKMKVLAIFITISIDVQCKSGQVKHLNIIKLRYLIEKPTLNITLPYFLA